MAKISEQQKEQMKMLFREGGNIPEIALTIGVSKSSVRKYLAEEIAAYTSSQTGELSPDQFVTYAQFEFNSLPDDIIQLKTLYYQLKTEVEQDYNKVIKLRKIYEARLNKIGKRKRSTNSQNSAHLMDNKLAIKRYNELTKIRIPLSRSAADWSLERLAEHLKYWSLADKSRKEANSWLASKESYTSTIQWLSEYFDEDLNNYFK